MAVDKQAYAWQLPKTAAARETLATAIYADGTRHIRVKAGGDGGGCWIPGGRYPSTAGPQWDDSWLEPFTRRGIRTTCWFYNWPGDADKAAIVAALAYRDSDELGLNPETEWRVASDKNPFRSLDEANIAAERWVNDLRLRLPHRVRIAFSAVPTWADFPYEGFAAACDQAEPQHYWPRDRLAGGKDQVEAHIRRAGAALPCVPILPCSREYEDSVVVALAVEAVEDYTAARDAIDGLSTWECGNSAYQRAAVAASYALLDGLGPVEPDANRLRAWFASRRVA